MFSKPRLLANVKLYLKLFLVSFENKMFIGKNPLNEAPDLFV